MQFRLNFDDEINADLLKKVGARAGNGSLNKALQIMIIEWNALEDAKNMPQSGHNLAENTSNSSESDNSDAIDFSGLDAAFGDTGE